ncbi:hypothetical protein BVRB_005480 [Beta vulgaris subsp. vulgaris]|uniref:Uncharacterized protein n=1 Tax=Beta vulgaris subsp. vulgaris TaxID=3555 RepID=A0A0J8B425_BETVV|nr:hypothetical protein BVRB_005480 [Beta vulgaris subsp. vulgaris]
MPPNLISSAQTYEPAGELRQCQRRKPLPAVRPMFALVRPGDSFGRLPSLVQILALTTR